MKGTYYPRFLQERIQIELSDTRIVFVCGPRQAGKTTLAQHVAGQSMPFVTFDDSVTRDVAASDPDGFVRRLDRAIIDEVQRVPIILLPLKRSVDEDQRPGRFLLTGSASLLRASRIADSLAGRLTTLHLWPLAQAELAGRSSCFLSQVFQGKVPAVSGFKLDDDLVRAVLAGGYPEALRRTQWQRRQTWYNEYIEIVLQRDMHDIARINQMSVMPELLTTAAALSGNLINYTTVGNAVGISSVTVRTYIGLLEQLFLLRRIKPWHSNLVKRLVKTPKLHFIDSGLLAALLGISLERIRRDRRLLGPLLESFVYAELLKFAGWTEERYRFYHFRDKDGQEVDFVIENHAGDIVGIEVKAAGTVFSKDYSALKRLEAACGPRFKHGIVLYDGTNTVPLGDRLTALPLSALWA